MPEAKEGLIHTSSPFSVAVTLERLETLLREKGMTIFTRIDHSGEAAKVGMEMHPTQVLIFGNPRGGTPPMLAAPTLAIESPAESPGLGRPGRQSLDHAQQRGISAAPPRLPARVPAESCWRSHFDPESCGIIIRRLRWHA